MEQLNGQIREITDFFWAQEKHVITAMWKSGTAVPGIKKIFLYFARHFISLMTYGPWTSDKSCEILNMQCLVVTKAHCWTEGNRGHDLGQLVLSSLCGGWCEHGAQCWDMPVQTFSMTYPASQPTQIPMGCQKGLQILQKTSHDTTRPIGRQETSCPSKVLLLTSGQLQNPFGLWEPNPFSVKHSFISLLCWYLVQ